MKKLFLLFSLIASASCAVFSQTPWHAAQEALFSATRISNEQTTTAVVIIDDDELGTCISPNPANSYINVTATKCLSNKTFSLVDNLGTTKLKQVLASSGNTIIVSAISNGTYIWVITDALNKKLSSGSLVIQH